jgi:hypothetical protein
MFSSLSQAFRLIDAGRGGGGAVYASVVVLSWVGFVFVRAYGCHTERIQVTTQWAFWHLL